MIRLIHIGDAKELIHTSYNERIKNFDRIREYMREFYVYGFKSREEFSQKSARSYDDEKRRIESWLGDYMGFYQTAEGKKVFLSIDSRASRHNPFFKAWKTRSFTDGDITLHFILFDILYDPGISMTVSEIVDRISSDYLSLFEHPMSFDDSTVRKKLKEYIEEGLVQAEKRGRQVVYRRAADTDLTAYADVLEFFSEAAPVGIIGSFLLDKMPDTSEVFAFKHHYITHVLDSEVLCSLFLAMRDKKDIVAGNPGRAGRERVIRVVPLRIFISAQNGRQYLLAFNRSIGRMQSYRIDYLENVILGEDVPDFDSLREKLDRIQEHMWGVMTPKVVVRMESVRFDIRIEDGEDYIVQRLEREKRCGTVERIDAHTCRFSADVYDAEEMVPWIRTFLCRIVDLRFSNPMLERKFRQDLEAMYAMYHVEGGDPS